MTKNLTYEEKLAIAEEEDRKYMEEHRKRLAERKPIELIEGTIEELPGVTVWVDKHGSLPPPSSDKRNFSVRGTQKSTL